MATDCQEDSFSSENPTKRIKTQSPTPESSSASTLFSSKGKKKLELETNCCGICLSEAAPDDNSVSRGYIDSCDHYFCFVCIMEWAKVESKCPLCKRRFSIIRRPAKPPIFPADRLVHVPVRDQVYDYNGNATLGPLDPYAEVKCSVCRSSVDESLLLLCDLCDSAAHTYCVGLGATVPDGDWFCHDCTLLRDERNKSEIDSCAQELIDSGKNDGTPPSHEHVSIFDIVREPYTRLVGRSSESCLSVHQVRNHETRLGDNVNVPDSRRQMDIVQGAAQLTGRTLHRCRNVHNRIQALRENWNSFRSGSLSFSSSKRNYECSADSKPKIGVDSVQPSSTSSSSLMDDGIPGASENRDSCEIDRAWKMLDMVKSIEKRKSTSCQSSNVIRSKYLSSESKRGSSENLAGFKKEQHQDCHSVWKDHNKHKPLMVERHDCHDQGFGNGSIGFEISPLPIYYQLISSQDVKFPIQHDVPHGNGKKPSHKISLGSTFAVSGSCTKPICTGFPIEPAPVSSNLVCPSIELNSSSSCKEESRVQNDAGQKFSVAEENYDAKSEIQSLVKLNLKLLTKDKMLEANVFKEVARLATHTILGACGLERPKRGVHPFPSSVCRHEMDNRHFRRSTLMPNSCRECFYVFVKDVVSAIMSERIGHVNTSS